MSHFLPLFRVAKLAGVSRHTLQEMMRDGGLDTFDGMVELNELLRAFPDTQWEDDGEYRRITEIKEKAFGKRVFERALPDKEVLAARLAELGKEYAATKALLMHYGNVLSWLDSKIGELGEDSSDETRQALRALRAFVARNLEEVPPNAEKVQALIAQERMLRIMSAQVTIRPSGHEFFNEGNDTLLEAALRAGISLEYGCSNGNCGDCKARLVSGTVRKVRPHDYVLSQADKDAGMILLCSCAAVDDVVIEAGVADAKDIVEQQLSARVKSVEVFHPGAASLHLLAPRSQRLRYLAGQTIRVSAHGASGHYALASCPCEERHIEIQVARNADDAFSELLFDGLKAGDSVELQGPYGEFVLDDESERPVLFVAFGTGFAPVKSLIQHVLSLDHAESIDLHWLADGTGHYQDNLCRSWADALDNFRYFPHAQSGDIEADLSGIVGAHPDLGRFDVYVSGTAEQVRAAKPLFLERGLPERHWHASAG
ncbi:MAG: 2Fe-2S iron-sulfur cluster binding domain-containing protein [Nitrosomonadales bacterium]|nr:2Fe-2S iron-sulfur cluster binding domain-containing protein [Nitrosomonadales bacterium]